ncbi:hypothetical protein AB0M97_16500 [Streptomyces sp. NPDC051207]|uniref:hypothetical protein n=1 Tax=Streptomyces sp. NPDC051207 TaxID=3154641 RepID=UPI003448FB76
MTVQQPIVRSRTLRLVGTAHLDPVWPWRRPESLPETRATLQSAAVCMKEYPDSVTFRVPRDPRAPVTETDLPERTAGR